MKDNEKIFSIKAVEELLDAYRELQHRKQELEGAIRWALGGNGEFPARQDGDHAYWWRTELRNRSRIDIT